MENMTLLIDPDTHDLVFDEAGFFKQIYDEDTTVQNVRHALLTWKAEFFADETHGTDYERIMGVRQNDIDQSEIEEIIRDAVFQEPDVSRIDEILIAYEKRSISVDISGVLTSGDKIRLEVTA